MEVGARRGAHFQLVRRGGTQSPITWRNPMKPRLILLFTLDRTFDQLVREAFLLVGISNLLQTVAAKLNQSRYLRI